MRQAFAIEDFAPSDRFEAIRSAFFEHYVEADIEVRDSGKGPNGFGLAAGQFGRLKFTAAQSTMPVRINRRPRHLARNAKDCCYLGINTRGTQECRQSGVSTICDSERAHIFLASEPYELVTPRAVTSLYIEIPCADLLDRLAGGVALKPVSFPIGSGMGKILAQICRTMASEHDHVSVQMRERMGEELLTILAATLEASTFEPCRSSDEATFGSSRLRQVQAWIDDHLSEPLLSPDRVAAANEMSLRTLHYLFKSTPMSVSDYIRERRLEYCRRELDSATAAGRSLTEIAFEAGFNSSAHFSSSFRQRFGLSPSEFRTRIARRS